LHAIPFNNETGLGGKEESFIKTNHQIGHKETQLYQGG
jgi:hypothetical protein